MSKNSLKPPFDVGDLWLADLPSTPSGELEIVQVLGYSDKSVCVARLEHSPLSGVQFRKVSFFLRSSVRWVERLEDTKLLEKTHYLDVE